jgi:hypothetical protein
MRRLCVVLAIAASLSSCTEPNTRFLGEWVLREICVSSCTPASGTLTLEGGLTYSMKLSGESVQTGTWKLIDEEQVQLSGPRGTYVGGIEPDGFLNLYGPGSGVLSRFSRP